MKTKNGKKKHAMLITSVTDPYGNYVKYDYDRDKRLTKIHSNDIRVIKMVYDRDGTLECAVANPDSKKKRVIYYRYKDTSERGQKYLSKAGIYHMGLFYEYDGLEGIYKHRKNEYARRCKFGTNAKIRYPSGLVVNIVTEKIVNFVEAESPDGHKSTSHRAACLKPVTEPPDPLAPENIGIEFHNPGPRLSLVRTKSIADGTSKHGKFSTYFTSAVTKLTVTDEENNNNIWTFEYDEGDEFNSGLSSSSPQSVHKNANKPVYIDITKPKKRTTVYPDGSKRVYMVGRSLNDTGLLISKEIFAKGSTKAAKKVVYGYEHSKKPLGKAWNRNHLNRKLAEHRTRLTKQVITLDGAAYTTKHEHDSYGFPTKTTKSSTLQSGSRIEQTVYAHNKSKWILGLVKTLTVNGKEILGQSYDANGNKILETRMGSQFRRYRWSGSRLIAERNGGDETTSYHSHKRGIPQRTEFENGATLLKEVDDNGWVTKKTEALGYVEEITYDLAGRETEIDRMAGYADTKIAYTDPVDRKTIYGRYWGSYTYDGKGIVKTETTGEGSQKRVKKTTFNWYGHPILIETRDVTNSVSVFVRFEYDELGREIFRSHPSFDSNETAGITTKYDVIGRKIQGGTMDAPYVKETYEYLSNNRVRTTDAEGNSTTVTRSGYGSPDDGKVIKIVEANGRTVYKRYDKWQNLVEERHVGAGKTRTSKFKFNSHHQLCFESHPDKGTKSSEYDDSGRVSREDYGVSENYVCPTPTKVVITSLTPRRVCTTTTRWVEIGDWREPDYVQKTETVCRDVYEKTKIKKAKAVTPPKSPKTSPATTPKTTPSTPSTPSTPQNKCPPEEVWNGTECVSIGNPYLTEPIETGILTTYNALGLETFIDFPSENTPDIRKTYDLAGNVTKIVRGNVTLEYTYGKRGELLTEKLTITETDENNKSTTKTYKVTYTYNSTGGLLSYRTPLNRLVLYSLNAFNQPTKLTVTGLTYISDVKYHANGDIKSALLHNTNKSKNTETIELTSTLNSQMLQSSYKLESDSDTEGDNDVVFSFSLTYDKNHRVKTVKRSKGTVTLGSREYSYDNMNQVISVTADSKNITFSYDSFENLLSRTGSDIQKNIYSVSNGMLTESATASIKSPTVLKDPISISHDKRGRITQFRKLTLAYDDSNRIYSVARADFAQSNLYDGNFNRVKAHYIEKKSGSSSSSSSQPRRTVYSFTSITGQLLHRSINTANVTTKSILYGEKPEDYDLIQFGNSLTLRFGDCANWTIQNSHNNLFVYLNPDTSIQAYTSADPFGTDIGSGGGSVGTCESHPVPTPIWPWTLPFGPIPITSPDPVHASLLGNNSQESTQYIYRNPLPDNVTQFFLLPNNRFYSSTIGRYLAPEFFPPSPHVRQVSNSWYSLARNHPVDFYYKFNRENRQEQLDTLGEKNSRKSESSFEYLRR